jgi:hypothetical protein
MSSIALDVSKPFQQWPRPSSARRGAAHGADRRDEAKNLLDRGPEQVAVRAEFRPFARELGKRENGAGLQIAGGLVPSAHANEICGQFVP